MKVNENAPGNVSQQGVSGATDNETGIDRNPKPKDKPLPGGIANTPSAVDRKDTTRSVD